MRISKLLLIILLLSAPRAWAQSANDENDNFNVNLFVGLAVDTFAASEHLRYVNPNSDGIRERFIGGIDFEKYLLTRKFGNLVAYGETIHGVRSAEIDCKANPELFICDQDIVKKFVTNPQNIGKNALYILRNATSLEGFTGLRYEFPVNLNGAVPYTKFQAGFLAVKDAGGGVRDLHHIGFGARQTSGMLRDSYLEAGFGRSDLFDSHRRRRLKVDAHLTGPINIDKLSLYIKPFIQITVDSDIGYGSDSIQSYFGFDVDVKKLIFRSND